MEAFKDDTISKIKFIFVLMFQTRGFFLLKSNFKKIDTVHKDEYFNNFSQKKDFLQYFSLSILRFEL